MRIYPRDLGSKWHVALLRRRAGQKSPKRDDPPPRLGLLGRWWTRGSGLKPEAAAEALRATAVGTHWLAHFARAGIGAWMTMYLVALLEEWRWIDHSDLPWLWLLLLAAWVVFAVVEVPHLVFWKLDRKPLRVKEIEDLNLTRRAVEGDYLVLLADAVRRNLSPQAEEDVRAALRALGDAMNHLPELAPVPGDAAALRSEAATVRAQGERETDPVIATSLLRRAEALERNADAGERVALLTRRAEALREEIRAQARALRAGLVAYHDSASDAAHLTHLAEAVRHVAVEAASITAAREELDVQGPSPWRGTPAEAENQRISLKRR